MVVKDKSTKKTSSTTKVEPKKQTTEKEQDLITLREIYSSFIEAYGQNSSEENEKLFNSIFSKYLKQICTQHKCSEKYNILILYDDTTLVKSDANEIYNAVTSFTEKKPILMILFSRGGSAGSAYLIGKLCREYSKTKFLITSPRYSKSAATLLCCAANEIHMGSLSELGPIDPQINKMPALGLKNAIEHIAELTDKYPSSSDMFAKFLKLSIDPVQIGYYERVAESAVQYATNLLNTHKTNLPKSANEIANRLVYEYKDHNYVIDKSEAKMIFSDKIIKGDSEEYKLGNSIYMELDFLQKIASIMNYYFYFIGSLDSKVTMKKKNK